MLKEKKHSQEIQGQNIKMAMKNAKENNAF